MKYVIRTSLAWLALIACAIWLFLYRVHMPPRQDIQSSAVQPLAVGPTSVQRETSDTASNAQFEMPLAPVQLTPERMQSIGVQTGTVEWKQITDHIRATGTVDINERLVSYVQIRFSG